MKKKTWCIAFNFKTRILTFDKTKRETRPSAINNLQLNIQTAFEMFFLSPPKAFKYRLQLYFHDI